MIVPEYLQSLKTGEKIIKAKDSKIIINNVKFETSKAIYLNEMEMPKGF